MISDALIILAGWLVLGVVVAIPVGRLLRGRR